MTETSEVTGQRILDWIDQHPGLLPQLSEWQRELIKAWGDGYTVLPARRDGLTTVRRHLGRAWRALVLERADQLDTAIRHAHPVCPGRGIVWSQLAAEIHARPAAHPQTAPTKGE